MKKKSTTAFFVLSLAVVLVAAASVVVRIAAYGMAGRAEASAEFKELGSILSAVRTAGDLEQPELRTRLKAYYRRAPAVLSLSVYERGGGIRWRIPADSDYLPPGADKALLPKPSYPDQSSVLFAASLPSDVSGKLAVDALYVTLTQQQVFVAFRDAGLGIVAWLILSGIVFLSLAIAGRNRPARGSADGETAASSEGTATAAKDADAGKVPDSTIESDLPDVPDLDEGFPGDEGATLQNSGPALDEAEFDIPELDNPISEDGLPPLDLPVEESPATEKAGGLYSPLSGLGWESYLSDRLDSELSRSASFEQDLSLLLIVYEGLAPGQEEYKVISKGVSEFFSFKDLAFERGPDGFAVILPNVDAEHGIRMAEEFLKKLTFILARDKPLSYIPVFMGLSSRSGRLVDSARLGQEAHAALQRARDEHDSHIIAFKPDPDRYRIYLASKAL